MFPVYIPLIAMSAVSALSVLFLYCKHRVERRQGYMDVKEKPCT